MRVLTVTAFAVFSVAILAICLGINAKWIGSKSLYVNIVGLPDQTLREASFYECYGDEEQAYKSKCPAIDFRTIEFTFDDTLRRMEMQLKTTGDDYFLDIFDQQYEPDFVLMEYCDPRSGETLRKTIRNPRDSTMVDINFTQESP